MPETFTMAETMALFPFHLAIPVTDLAAAEHFYVQVLGSATGRRSDQWIDLNLFGHQLWYAIRWRPIHRISPVAIIRWTAMMSQFPILAWFWTCLHGGFA